MVLEAHDFVFPDNILPLAFDFPENYGGHIGHFVVSGERRKGFASQMLKTALTKCKESGNDKVLIICIDKNEGSRKTILAIGGLYAPAIYDPDEKVYLERYWITHPG